MHAGLGKRPYMDLHCKRPESHRTALHSVVSIALSVVFATVCLVWQVWDTGQCKCVHTLRGHKQPVQRIAICGKRLYSTAGRTIRVWDVATFECLQVIRTQQDCGALLAMTAAPDGTVYVGGQVCPATLPCSAKCPAAMHSPLSGSDRLLV